MNIPTHIAGHLLEPLTTEVEWRATTNFAAAIGDPNPRYLDDSREGGLQVHPVFPVVLSWPLIASLAQRLDGLIPAEAVMRMVHATERIVWRRILVPGDGLQIEGRIQSLSATPAGALVSLALEARRKNGELVYTEEIGGLFRGVSIEGQDLPAKAETGMKTNFEPIWTEPLPVGASAAHRYDGCTDIVFPIHTSQAFAKAVGLPGIVLQGTCALAMAVSRIVDREAEGDPSRVSEVACSFRKPIVPGSQAQIEVCVRQKAADQQGVGFELKNAIGQVALRDGWVGLQGEPSPTP